MKSALLSIKYRNLYGNVMAGCCLFVLGLARAAAPSSPVVLTSAVFVLTLSVLNLRACSSKFRERNDEMAERNSRHASSLALWFVLIAIGLACAFGMVFGISVDLASSSCLILGVAMAAYGVSFAWLERRE